MVSGQGPGLAGLLGYDCRRLKLEKVSQYGNLAITCGPTALKSSSSAFRRVGGSFQRTQNIKLAIDRNLRPTALKSSSSAYRRVGGSSQRTQNVKTCNRAHLQNVFFITSNKF